MKKLIFILISMIIITTPILKVSVLGDDVQFEFVTPCVWQSMGYQYSEGLIPVQEPDFNGIKGKWGYMDRFGELKVPIQWDSASSFSEGLAAVQLDGKWGYINISGEIVIPLQFGSAHDFQEGIAVVWGAEITETGLISLTKAGYIDKTGNIVVPLEWDYAYVFADGFGKVKMYGKQGTMGQLNEPDTYAIFDRNGVRNTDWDFIDGPGHLLDGESYFSEGLVWVTGSDRRGYIDETGELLISLPTNSVGSPFNSGRALVCEGTSGFDYIYYYIDRTGQKVIELNSKLNSHPHDFNKGYAVIPDDTQHYGNDRCIIDTDGNILTKLSEQRGVAYYDEEKKTALLYASQNFNYFIHALKYDGDISKFENVRFYLMGSDWYPGSTVARISVDNAIVAAGSDEKGYHVGYGVFDKNLNQIIPFEYQSIKVLSDNCFMVSKNHSGPYALIDRNNNIISDYSNITFKSPKEDRFVVWQYGVGWGIVRFFDDGELYQAEPAKIIGVAQTIDIVLNTVTEKAFIVNNDVYIGIETLRGYGISVSNSNDGKNFRLARQTNKDKINIVNILDLKEEYNVYSSAHNVFIGDDVVDSLLIENFIAVNIDDLQIFGTIKRDNGIVRLYIDRPYMQNEGVTWEWRTDVFDKYIVKYRNGTYSLFGHGLGVELFAVDGKLLYKDDTTRRVDFDNGLWRFSSGYLDDKNQTFTWVDLQGEIVETTQEFSETPQLTTSTPSPTEEYPTPLYESRDFWTGSLSGSRWSKPVSTGKYTDENGNIALDNPDWTWTESFQNGTALVNVGGSYNPVGSIEGGQWGIINTSGDYIIEPVWGYAYRQYDGNIIVTFENKQGLVDDNGVQKIPAIYNRIYNIGTFNSKIVMKTELGRECGLLDTENNTLLPLIFNEVRSDVNNYYSVSYFDGSGYSGETGIIELIETPFLSGSVFINSEKIEFDNPPLLINNRTMIPIRAVFEKLGFAVDWEGETQTVMIDGNNTQIRIVQDKNGFFKNSEYWYSDMPSINFESRIYLPLRAISEALGCNVDYDDVTGNVFIDY